jgi:hypothetical protein
MAHELNLIFDAMRPKNTQPFTTISGNLEAL